MLMVMVIVMVMDGPKRDFLHQQPHHHHNPRHRHRHHQKTHSILGPSFLVYIN
jgi:hypothetical protein